ncbi:MAG TPA: glycosyltransferase family 2 protein [Candidatus Baltobacteraceae bacterium]|nr:glycosyltransferase family 2 protein [Candidatus Baltobacteraceae bacterium]
MSVAAIVPAFDEEKNVGRVVRTLKASRGVGEVIVVSDGSTDRTAQEAEAAGARVIGLRENVGKGGAVKMGAAATRAEILFLCDADFLGLAPEHVERILAPVLEGRLAMCTGLRDRGPLLTRAIAHLPLLSGERALRREVLDGVPRRFLQGFRLEMSLNWYCRANRLPYGSVPTLGVGQVRKIEKVGLLRGLAGYAVMVWEVADAMIRVRFAKKEFLKR